MESVQTTIIIVKGAKNPYLRQFQILRTMCTYFRRIYIKIRKPLPTKLLTYLTSNVTIVSIFHYPKNNTHVYPLVLLCAYTDHMGWLYIYFLCHAQLHGFSKLVFHPYFMSVNESLNILLLS